MNLPTCLCKGLGLQAKFAGFMSFEQCFARGAWVGHGNTVWLQGESSTPLEGSGLWEAVVCRAKDPRTIPNVSFLGFRFAADGFFWVNGFSKGSSLHQPTVLRGSQISQNAHSMT